MHAQPTTEVTIKVEGAWLYADDPSDGTKIVLIAPQFPSHKPPSVQFDSPMKDQPLPHQASLTIDNFKSAKGACGAGCKAAVMYYAPIDKSVLKSAMANGSAFVVRLPKPSYASSDVQEQARLSKVWWPQATKDDIKEDTFTTVMILHYSVPTVKGFALNSNAMALQPGNMITLMTQSIGTDNDPCDLEARQTFKSLADFFSLKLFLDLPATGTNPPMYWPGCLKLDPQNPSSGGQVPANAFAPLRQYLQNPSGPMPDAAQADLQAIVDSYQQVVKSDATGDQKSALAELQQVNKPTPGTPKPSSAQLLKDLDTVVHRTGRAGMPPHAGGGACGSTPLCGNPPGIPCL